MHYEMDPAMLEAFAEAVELSHSPIFVKTLDEVYLFANRAFRRYVDKNDIVGRTGEEVFDAASARKFAAEDDRCVSEGRVTGHRYGEDGRRWIVEKVCVTLPDGSPGIVGLVFEITSYHDEQQSALAELRRLKSEAEAKALLLEEAKEKIEYVSLHDAHTGLANRRYLDKRLKEAEREGERIAVLHIDLDRFKQINDTYGHFAGDHVLRQVATTMTQVSRLGDFVSRVGGDEFAILCPHDGDDAPILDLAERLVERLSHPIRYKGLECRIGASVGVAMPSDDAAPDQLLVNADMALYRAKTEGRGRVELFSAGMNDDMREDLRLAEDVRRGLEENEFCPFYEPQIDARTLELCGVEALARWRHPEDGLLLPSRFIAVAERHDRIADIDAVILSRAIQEIRGLRADGHNIPHLSVNVSGQRLADGRLLDSLRGLKLEPGELSFELVETILFDEIDESWKWQIDSLREMGIGIEVDDFGTGYASIISLLRVSPDRMKIDRQFVAGVVESEHARKVISAIIDIARSLEIAVVAEGVETMEQVSVLRAMGVDALQGWFFSKPMDLEELAAYAQLPAHARLAKSSPDAARDAG
ncbi:putative bifunctional diguanylate cyclase/phosphodiesterase [Pontivivens ytuae]|uniref:EAL domain-containing protein n=1 Tax=Pontivivens ytuae TaxID=2789856 RepID=A0A7S9LR89_9RHOB|nr:EAL domain-containing protein [Pontivivens ytuae]QPH53836.1 EAL domain-containing protein [Pontivivens ytuae]